MSKTITKIKQPKILLGKKLQLSKDFPVDHYSYSMWAQFMRNPTIAKIKYINNEAIETERSASGYLGKAVHRGLQVYLGGDDEYPVVHDKSEAIKYALDATSKYVRSIPDAFIKYTSTIPNNDKLLELAISALQGYINEFNIDEFDEIVAVEQKIQGNLVVKHNNKVVEMPVPLVVVPDLVVRINGKLAIIDHKIVYSYPSGDEIDGAKLIQAGFNYFAALKEFGEAPSYILFREYKYTKNKDGSKQTRIYKIDYSNAKIVFDLFIRLYDDITAILLGEMRYIPNIFDMFDKDVAVLAYAQGLDIEQEYLKAKKRSKVSDITELLRKRIARRKDLKMFMKANENKFITNVNLDYSRMSNEERIKYKFLQHGYVLNFIDKIEGYSFDLYRFMPEGAVRMNTLQKFAKDIEQVLGVSGVRVLAPIPDTEYVGFEVPRKERRFPEKTPKTRHGAVAVGVDMLGNPYYLNIAEAPHVLVAGSTGSGKSVLLESIIVQTNRLPEWEIYIIDPKGVDFAEYDGQVSGYITEKELAADLLNQLVAVMEDRYKTLKSAKAKNIDEYNEKTGAKMKKILVVIDEFGDLTVGKSKASEIILNNILKLSQKARAAGIHLVIATQRPDTKVISGRIKVNFPVKIALAVPKDVDSRVILGEAGAEKLAGKGDMLIQKDGKITRLQAYKI